MSMRRGDLHTTALFVKGRNMQIYNYVFEAFKYTESLISSYFPSSLSTVEIRICFIA